LKVWAGRNDYAVFVDSARTKTLSGDDQPDLLLLNQDNGENWLGFTGQGSKIGAMNRAL
jgi:hypothetical protein